MEGRVGRWVRGRDIKRIEFCFFPWLAVLDGFCGELKPYLLLVLLGIQGVASGSGRLVSHSMNGIPPAVADRHGWEHEAGSSWPFWAW